MVSSSQERNCTLAITRAQVFLRLDTVKGADAAARSAVPLRALWARWPGAAVVLVGDRQLAQGAMRNLEVQGEPGC